MATNNIEDYKKAITLLENLEEENCRHILFKLAAMHPKTFCAVIEEEDIIINSHVSLNVRKQAKELLASETSENKIEAIRMVREQTGMGLKEAKEYVETL